jgi:hypothetical protein
MQSSNSLEAYLSIIETLPRKRADVFRVIKEYGPVTNKQIAMILAWPINCVTGRTNELCSIGVVESAGLVKEPKSATQWRIKCPV